MMPLNERRTRTLRSPAAALAAVFLLTLPLDAAEIDWSRAKDHWSFRAPRAPGLPAIRRKEWPRRPLDRFILARLEQNGLAPAREAEPRTLIRRVTYDLTGLPPTPEEVEAFVEECRAQQSAISGQQSAVSDTSATSPSAKRALRYRQSAIRNPQSAIQPPYERLVDRLLASPRFGERMASMWLPLARYAEDQAHQVGSDTKFFYPNAHRYRQWVIDAFNRDLSYDRFTRLQLAADRMPDAGKEDLAALGFLGLGPKYYNRNRLEVMADEWQDRVDTVTRTFLGLTVACARCHDHKYDPVGMHDYYALAGVFASTKLVNKAPQGVVEAPAEAAKVGKETLHIVEEDAPRDLNLFVRGNVENKGEVVPRRFLRVLSEGDPVPFRQGSGRAELAAAITAPDNPLTARVMVNRLWGLFFGVPLVGTPSNFGLLGDRPTHPELLDYLASSFTSPAASNGSAEGQGGGGAGGIGEAEGQRGRGVEGIGDAQRSPLHAPRGLGWSVKALVREIVLSSTYRQSSRREAASGSAPARSRSRLRQARPKVSPNPQSLPPVRGAAIRNPQSQDPENRLLSRMNRRRLAVEQWRDSVLSVSGLLETGGGPSLELTDPANRKRTLYARISRLKLHDVLMQFDYPDANVHAEKRSATTTPMQKLFLLNSPFVLEQARALAARLAALEPADEGARIRRAYLLLYARSPTPHEVRLGLEFLGKPEAEGMPRWERYAQALLAANEMLYLD